MLRLLNESPRWLVLKKEYAAARRIIGQMASANNKELPPDFDVFKIAVNNIKTTLKLYYVQLTV